MEDTVAGDFFTFQQDNAPGHRAGDTVEFLSHNTPDFISPLLWPPNSPDLNPVDYEVWGVLKQDSRRRPLETASHGKVALLRPEHH